MTYTFSGNAELLNETTWTEFPLRFYIEVGEEFAEDLIVLRAAGKLVTEMIMVRHAEILTTGHPEITPEWN